jgi:hypothetical protein
VNPLSVGELSVPVINAGVVSVLPHVTTPEHEAVAGVVDAPFVVSVPATSEFVPVQSSAAAEFETSERIAIIIIVSLFVRIKPSFFNIRDYSD